MDGKKLMLPEKQLYISQSVTEIQGPFIQSTPNSDTSLYQLLQAEEIYTS